mgnify:CR=1 FL=1
MRWWHFFCFFPMCADYFSHRFWRPSRLLHRVCGDGHCNVRGSCLGALRQLAATWASGDSSLYVWCFDECFLVLAVRTARFILTCIHFFHLLSFSLSFLLFRRQEQFFAWSTIQMINMEEHFGRDRRMINIGLESFIVAINLLYTSCVIDLYYNKNKKANNKKKTAAAATRQSREREAELVACRRQVSNACFTHSLLLSPWLIEYLHISHILIHSCVKRSQTSKQLSIQANCC